MEEVAIDERINIQFITRLKLTGDLIAYSYLVPLRMCSIFVQIG